MIGILIRRGEDIESWREDHRKDRGRHWSYAITSQGMQEPQKLEEAMEDSLLLINYESM